MKKVILILFVVFTTNILSSQNYKFGEVSKEELQEKVYPLDSSANAAILYKERKTSFDYVPRKGFNVVTEVFLRLKIYNKEGFKWATNKITYHESYSGNEKISGLKANTYNLEGNKIVETKLDRKDIFEENLNKYWSQQKFTMPNIKEGSIVEWRYKLISPFKRIDDVQFQYEIPVKKMNASIETPEYFVYKKRSKGYFQVYPKVEKKHQKITINTKNRSDADLVNTTFSSSSLNYVSNIEKYDITDVPALIEEQYVNNIDNYRSMMEYEFSELHLPNKPIKYFSKSWEDVTKTIYRDSDFSNQIYKSNHFEDDLALVLDSAKTETEKIIAIFELIKHKIKWNDYGGIATFNGTRKAYKEGVGNAADINLNLVSMLNSAGFNANPVIISTRSNGIPFFPTINGFNFVIAAVELEDELVLLDATDIYSSPNNLPLRDLNWNGRLIRKDGSSKSVNLIPSEPSQETINMMVSFDEEGGATGMYRKLYQNLSAQNYRNAKGKLKDEDIIAEIEAKYSGIEIDEFKIQNKENSYKTLVEMYEFSSESMIDKIGNKIYLNPFLYNAKTVNPFKLEVREYPIDFGTPILEKINISITIPEGYSIVSIPEKLAIALSNNYGVYKYNISSNGNKINLQSHFKINTAIYPVQNYEEIKEFYKLIIEKNLEQVVLVKST